LDLFNLIKTKTDKTAAIVVADSNIQSNISADLLLYTFSPCKASLRAVNEIIFKKWSDFSDQMR
jgi:hypothetical protein